MYPRDLMGYGETPPYADWPNGAKIAVQVVLNFEEGGENCILHGDESSEAFLSEIPNAKPFIGERHMNMESIYEYGARAGFWRLRRIFTERNIPLSVFGCGHGACPSSGGGGGDESRRLGNRLTRLAVD